jgi:hypothetical protein
VLTNRLLYSSKSHDTSIRVSKGSPPASKTRKMPHYQAAVMYVTSLDSAGGGDDDDDAWKTEDSEDVDNHRDASRESNISAGYSLECSCTTSLPSLNCRDPMATRWHVRTSPKV